MSDATQPRDEPQQEEEEECAQHFLDGEPDTYDAPAASAARSASHHDSDPGDQDRDSDGSDDSELDDDVKGYLVRVLRTMCEVQNDLLETQRQILESQRDLRNDVNTILAWMEARGREGTGEPGASIRG